MMTKDFENLEDYDYSMVEIIKIDQTTDLFNTPKGIFDFDSILRRAKDNEIIADISFVNELAVLNKLLTKSHKLTSKKYSVWKLLARYLDLPTNEVLQHIHNPSVKMLIGDFQFSSIGKLAPAYYFDHERWVEEDKDEENYFAYVRKNTNTDNANTSYLQIRKNLSEWDQNIRFSISALLAQQESKLANTLHIEVLELIREIIEKLRSHRFSPKYTKHANYETFGTKKSKIFDIEIKYCELCWRHTSKSTKVLQNGAIPFRDLCQSNRYCHIHNPSDPRSKYRADLRYKEAFEKEVAVLEFAELGKSNFPLTFKYTEGYEQELRKAAYDLVHSKLLLNLHKLPCSPKKSLAAQVLELKQKGLKQSEIARTLNKSRQEISRANKKLKSILIARKNETFIYSDTDEAYTLLKGRKPNNDAAQIGHALKLKDQGLSVSKISSSLGRYPHTVNAMLNELSKTA
jgi:hypothetical protein